MRSRSFVLVGIGGALGALARYEVGLLFPVASRGFPWTTLAINVSGAFALGVLLSLVLEVWPPARYVRPFAAIGFLGGYTTFSTFCLEIARLIQQGRPTIGFGYAVASLGAGMAAIVAGSALVRAGVRR